MPRSKRDNRPLDQRWLDALRKTPLIAAIIVCTVVISQSLSFWNQLPPSLVEWLRCRVQSCTAVAGPSTGWVFAGYADPYDPLTWTSDPRVSIVRQSNGQRREHLIREGDVVQALQVLPQVIVDYAEKRTANQMIAPWKLKGTIDKRTDFTGVTYPANTRLEVLEVTASQFPGHDLAIWLRVQPVG